MDALLSSLCEWRAGADVGMLGAACLAMVGVLLVLIVLGVGPLRSWLGGHAARGNDVGELGLLGNWRLYRRLRETRHA